MTDQAMTDQAMNYAATAKVLSEVLAERQAQDAQWGGIGHDRLHTSHDWVAYLTQHVGRAVTFPFNWVTYRREMVKVAALAVAAIEWVDYWQSEHARERANTKSGM